MTYRRMPPVFGWLFSNQIFYAVLTLGAAMVFGNAPLAIAADAIAFYVSPTGDDAAAGTLEHPFKSPARGRDALRALKRQQGGKLAGPATLYFRGGTYFLSEPLTLLPADSGTADAPITYSAYQAEIPVFSAGRPIGGWREQTLNGRTVWAAHAPQLTGRIAPPLRSLWVNGRRAIRARSPNQGHHLFKVADVPDATGEWTKGQNNFRFHPGDLKNSPGLAGAGAEVVLMSRWVESRLPVTAIDDGARSVRFGKPSVFVIQDDDRYWIEGAADFLDEPGEWNLDRATAMLYYIPRPGEAMAAVNAVVPMFSHVARLDGKPEAGQYISHVAFRGITFSHADWGQGWPGADQALDQRSGFNQAAIGAPAAVQADGAQSCTFDHCTIAHVGAYGLSLGRGCQNNRVIRCKLIDLGAGGIKIGETAIRENTAEQAFGNEVSDSRITDAGKLFPSAVGLWIGQSFDNRISHNEIANLYYTGISAGWTWGYDKALAKGNIVEHNHVHHVGQPAGEPEPILSDMAGIYTLGKQPGTVIAHNRFHDIAAIKYGGWGIYFDEGSSDIVAQNNVVYRTTHGGFHQHYGKDNIFRNNIIAMGRDFQVQRTRAEDHRSFTFERNIVYWSTGQVVTGGWESFRVEFDKNTYWQTNGRTDYKFAGLSLDQWRAKGMDVHSIQADPKFVAPQKDDFNLQPDSPAIGLAFKPFNQSDVGPRPE